MRGNNGHFDAGGIKWQVESSKCSCGTTVSFPGFCWYGVNIRPSSCNLIVAGQLKTTRASNCTSRDFLPVCDIQIGDVFPALLGGSNSGYIGIKEACVPIISLNTEHSCSNSFLGSEGRRRCTSVSASKIWTSRYALLTRPARSIRHPAGSFYAAGKRACEARWVRRRERQEAHSGNSNAQCSMLIPMVVRAGSSRRRERMNAFVRQ